MNSACFHTTDRSHKVDTLRLTVLLTTYLQSLCILGLRYGGPREEIQ